MSLDELVDVDYLQYLTLTVGFTRQVALLKFSDTDSLLRCAAYRARVLYDDLLE